MRLKSKRLRLRRNQVSECYANGANSFLRKPAASARILAIVRALDLCMSYRQPRLEWLAKLPEHETAPIGTAAPLERLTPRLASPVFGFIANRYPN